RGAIVRSKRAGPQTDAHGNISRGLFCLPFTPGLAPVPSVEQPYSLLSAADGLMSLAACSIAGRRARERDQKAKTASPPSARTARPSAALEKPRAAVRR